VLDALRVARSGFPDRLPFADFVVRKITLKRARFIHMNPITILFITQSIVYGNIPLYLDALRVARTGFPDRFPFADFVVRPKASKHNHTA